MIIDFDKYKLDVHVEETKTHMSKKNYMVSIISVGVEQYLM